MIKFIICDDNLEFALREKQIVDNYMMNYDIEYTVKIFDSYGKDFKEEAKDMKGFKVYLLDIEIFDASGIDETRYIREELNDWNSVIIMVTAHNEFKYEALGNRLFVFDFINKLDAYEKRLREDLDKINKKYGYVDSCLTFEFNHVLNRIEFKDIIEVTKEKDSKRCNIRTTYGNAVICKTLVDVMILLDRRFIKTSRSSLINLDYVVSYDSVNNIIMFKDGTTTIDISRDRKKDVMNHVKNLR